MVEQFVLADLGLVGHEIGAVPVDEVGIDCKLAFLDEVHLGVGVAVRGHLFM
jgi:hypothetical protein